MPPSPRLVHTQDGDIAGRHRVFLRIYVIMVCKYTHSLSMPTVLFRIHQSPIPHQKLAQKILRRLLILAWKRFLQNKPKKDARLLCRGEKASYGGGSGILGYLRFKTKGNYHYAHYEVFNANRGHWSYWSLILWIQPSDYSAEELEAASPAPSADCVAQAGAGTQSSLGEASASSLHRGPRPARRLPPGLCGIPSTHTRQFVLFPNRMWFPNHQS